ncbi:MAG TPA: hypothetical protein VFY06_13945 [Verrucomicrobiae bacterium]|nr:hypothetical protein [Verrucomicrobiae bacterium]
MHKLHLILIAAVCAPVVALRAQDTNALNTKIGIFEAQTGVVIIKGFERIGTVRTGAAEISVRCKESTSAASGYTDYGIALAIDANQWRGFALVDYDELAPLLNGMDSIGKMNYNVTALPAFEATFTTRSSLRLMAHGDRLEGGIRMYLQYNDGPRIQLTSDQWAQLARLIQQAKARLDSLKSGG